MEAGGDNAAREDGGDFDKPETESHITQNENLASKDLSIEKTELSCHNELILENTTDGEVSDSEKSEDKKIVLKETSDLKNYETGGEEGAVSSLPKSNSVSENSEKEINHDPLSPADESASTFQIEPSAESSTNLTQKEEDFSADVPPGPADDREDISDDELEVDSTEFVYQASKQMTEHVPPDSVSTEITLNPVIQVPESSISDPHLLNDDTRETLSSDDQEIIDLKLEDAVAKSEEGGEDANRDSKGPSEDLEAVSDDELIPETGVTALSANMLLIGEEVSSEEDTSLNSAKVDAQTSLRTMPLTNQEVAYISDGSVDHTMTLVKGDSLIQFSSEKINSLQALEAEPISDEEDGEQDGSIVGGDGDGEAGEIRSPVPNRSPVSESGLLGEVEPISADENSDTDGELHSADEDSRPEMQIGKSVSHNFESIESDEEGDIETNFPPKQTLKALPDRRLRKSDYMETISDEEISEVTQEASEQAFLVDLPQRTSPIIKDIETDKKQETNNFNEHQVELDYEENEGDEGETKIELLSSEPKSKREGAEEEGELDEVAGTDKDEGELSDDDCEEGEIKEPGSKKPFVKPICRFFQRGNCTWGVSCRFLHPGVNDKGNYQMIEMPGFKPPGIRNRLGVPGVWPEQVEEPIELPPPPVPDIPPAETAWERGLRIAKEQKKKANERKELEPDFEDKRLNLSIDEERELNKENERMPKVAAKDPYFDQQVFEEDEYYKIPREQWQTGHYENFEVRYYRENSYSPPYRDKAPVLPQPRFNRPFSPPIDKFGRDRIERREPFRVDLIPPSVTPTEYPPSAKRADEWTDPWRRSKSPQAQKPKIRSHSRGRRAHRSVSDSSHSSRSSSGSSSGSSRSSRSFSGSSGSSSRSRSLEPAPPGVDRHDRYMSPSREPPRSAVTVRGRGGYNHYDQNYYRNNRGYERPRENMGGGYQPRGNYRGGGGNGGYYNNYGNSGGPYPDRERGRDDRLGRNRARSPPDRPLPYVRPRPKSASSRSSSSRSRTRSRGRFTPSHSRSSSGSSRSSSSSSSSAGSADSEHLYRDLGPPSKNSRGSAVAKKKRTNSHKEHLKGNDLHSQSAPLRGQPPPPHSPINLDRIPHPRDPKPSQPSVPSSRNDSKYASRNAPQAPVKAKDPLKVVGQKSNIKLTLLPKQQQSSLGSRPNPLDSPPHGNKRRLPDRELAQSSEPPPKRPNMPPLPQPSTLRLATEKATKLQMRQEKIKSPPPASLPQPPPSSGATRPKLSSSPQKQPSSAKSRTAEPAVAKAVPKIPSANAPTATSTGSNKAKKSMSSRREELLKQLKAVEDAIARKKSKLQ